ncbi:MAG: MotA/TolQ/ExbB proton channel family protein [Candidatus Marinimicrobia bacterium]|nr:MotA/TolQ/ExbB proton channel family protein [Candidatus Neomarinimicrobiota bacterium]
MVELYHQGGAFMHPILVIFIFGLVIVIERFYTLTKALTVTRKFLHSVNESLENNGVQSAVEVCENTPGPVAEIFHAGLSRYPEGLSAVEKSIQSAGQIAMAFLEKNMTWLTTVSTIAPLLGFTGTVWGMVIAFQDIAAANDISPAIVAGGISMALLTTLFGLVVAMIIQIAQNTFAWIIDKLILHMESSSVDLMDKLTQLEIQGKLGN